MSHFCDTLGGLYQLLRLALVSRLRLRGPYWTWRLQTAFGRGYPATRLELVRSVLAYGRWVHTMRRGHQDRPTYPRTFNRFGPRSDHQGRLTRSGFPGGTKMPLS